ncbi:MAG: hypothetical protein ACXWP5_02785 [Bdellovibrionota bacterium]
MKYQFSALAFLAAAAAFVCLGTGWAGASEIPVFEVQNWTSGAIKVNVDNGAAMCDIDAAASSNGYSMSTNQTIDLADGRHYVTVYLASYTTLYANVTINRASDSGACLKVLENQLIFQTGLDCTFAPGR